jgi:hypothetical protein
MKTYDVSDCINKIPRLMLAVDVHDHDFSIGANVHYPIETPLKEAFNHFVTYLKEFTTVEHPGSTVKWNTLYIEFLDAENYLLDMLLTKSQNKY